MTKQPKIAITRKIPDAGIHVLEEKYDVAVYPHDHSIPQDELLDFVKDADAIISLLTDSISEEVIKAAGKNLKIIANYATGYNNINVKAAKERDIYVTNTPKVSGDPVAEFTAALILSLVKRVPEGMSLVQQGEFTGWSPLLLPGIELRGKTLGVIGAGAIGRATARIMHQGFGMNIVYYDIREDSFLETSCKASKCSLTKLLVSSDVISVHVPLNKHTHHLLDEEKLALVGPDSYIVNTARGAVIDEIALTQKLKENKIKGAALDVFEFEPDVTEELKNMDNVILTPHLGSSTIETRSEMAEMVAKCVIEAIEGREPPYQVSV